MIVDSLLKVEQAKLAPMLEEIKGRGGRAVSDYLPSPSEHSIMIMECQ